MFLSCVGPRSVTARSSRRLDLPVGFLRQADRARRGDAFQSRGDVDAVAHQVAVALLDDVAHMNADPKDDPAVLRHAGVALDHGVLHFDRAAHGVDDAAEFDDRAVAGALDDPPVVHALWSDRSDRCEAPAAAPGCDPRPRRPAGSSQPHRPLWVEFLPGTLSTCHGWP